MSAKNTSEVNAALKFFEFDALPTAMKTLNQKYKQLALKYHPDKAPSSESASTENFQLLDHHYKVLGDCILLLNTGATDTDDAEEVQVFRNFCSECRNKESWTIGLDPATFSNWRPVLKQKYGDAKDLGANGFMYKIKFTVEEESLELTVTLYESTKNMHVQSGSQFFNDQFVFNVLPSLFSEVRKMDNDDKMDTEHHGLGPAKAGEQRPKTPRPKRTSATKRLQQQNTRTRSKVTKYTCKDQECDKGFHTMSELKFHAKAAHIVASHIVAKQDSNSQEDLKMELDANNVEESNDKSVTESPAAVVETETPVREDISTPAPACADTPVGVDAEVAPAVEDSVVTPAVVVDTVTPAPAVVVDTVIPAPAVEDSVVAPAVVDTETQTDQEAEQQARLDKDEADRLNSIIDQKEATIRELEDKMKALEKEKDKLRQTIEDIEASIQNSREEVIDDLEKKISLMEKENKKLKKDSEADMKKVLSELKVSQDEVSKLTEDNALLEATVQTYKNNAEADKDIQQKAEEILKRSPPLDLAQEAPPAPEHEEDDINVWDIVRNKSKGGRRVDPASPPVVTAGPSGDPAAPISANINASTGGNNEGNEKFKCDICTQKFSSALNLRIHLRDTHKKVDGIFVRCTICHYGALSLNALKHHTDRDHKVTACTECNYKTKSPQLMKSHKASQHKKNITCRYWLRGSCRKANCIFKHEIVGEKSRQKQQQQTPPWINPAYNGVRFYDREFPFLGQISQNQAPLAWSLNLGQMGGQGWQWQPVRRPGV